MVSKASAVGIHAYLEKLFSVKTLIESLTMLINKQRTKIETSKKEIYSEH